MQITLIQAEIELAIREFVNKRVSIAEDINVAIDLRATRGDLGFTAVIDLTDVSPEGTSSAEVRPLAITEKVKTARATPAKAALSVPETPKAPLEEAQEATQEAAAEADAAEGNDSPLGTEDAQQEGAEEAVGNTSDAADPAPQEQEQSQEEAPPPAEKPKSLFANLGKPRNNN